MALLRQTLIGINCIDSHFTRKNSQKSNHLYVEYDVNGQALKIGGKTQNELIVACAIFDCVISMEREKSYKAKISSMPSYHFDFVSVSLFFSEALKYIQLYV